MPPLTPEQLVAHRGLPATHPENTLAGLAAALETGARYVEFDLQLSRDGVPFLLHDPTLERTGDRWGDALALAWHELAPLPAHEPARLGETHRGEKSRIPSLDQVADLLAQWPTATAFAEIKEESLERHGVARVTDAVLAALAPVARQTVIISFAPACLHHVRRVAPHWPVGLVLTRFDAANRATARALAADWLFVDAHQVPSRTPLWEGGWRWVVYDLNHPAAAREWLERGTHLVETSDCATLLGSHRGEGS